MKGPGLVIPLVFDVSAEGRPVRSETPLKGHLKVGFEQHQVNRLPTSCREELFGAVHGGGETKILTLPLKRTGLWAEVPVHLSPLRLGNRTSLCSWSSQAAKGRSWQRFTFTFHGDAANPPL